MPQLPSFSERMKIREEEEAQRSDMEFSREAARPDAETE